MNNFMNRRIVYGGLLAVLASSACYGLYISGAQETAATNPGTQLTPLPVVVFPPVQPPATGNLTAPPPGSPNNNSSPDKDIQKNTPPIKPTPIMRTGIYDASGQPVASGMQNYPISYIVNLSDLAAMAIIKQAAQPTDPSRLIE